MQVKAAAEYQLIIEHVGPAPFRSIESYETLPALIESAAEYWAGEFPGRVVGCFRLIYNHNGFMIGCDPIADLDRHVAALLSDSPTWRETQHRLTMEDRAIAARLH